ncbi:uncharacterized protein LOC123524866 [Mercenaria mercenaria]|uniref:uncharacterized protein LOC123524866 n=1 Tax=Mercenaria mercenaria TaxID=6596 RepID=UPI00234EA5DD|nr:uncharacterized protein LOC123524866 [Mercenaria mercenaria]XP_045159327.2 uncharacterized protein LOC123524866 [Mercenaria mercenaria]XP_045159328.2 uncharacterized protein LOC123524866 [Mercenaria mercenaria]
MVGHSGHHGMAGHSPFLQLQTSATLLVPEWSTESIYGLIGAMLAAVAASVTYECLSEYLQHIKRKALIKRHGPECCGASVVTFGEKLGQSIIQMLRVVFAYFMMLCVMTMNVWLLIAVVVGAFVGYGVGKPLVANRIDDSFTSHGYDSVPAKVHRHGNNKSERSRSWRYQPIVKPNQDSKTRQIDPDDIFLPGVEELDSTSKYSNNARNGADIVWIRRSSEELRQRPSEISDVFEDSDIQLRSQDDTLNFDSIRSEGRHSSQSSSRFRSTSKVINDSFRSYKSESEMRKHSTSANTSLNVSFDSQMMDNSDRRHKESKSSTKKVNRTTSAASSSRFKPVSREIMRQMSFNDDLS